MSTINYTNKIIVGDALEKLKLLSDDSIDVIVTDPPYFLDKLDNQWSYQQVSKVTENMKIVKSLPAGMKFDREQGKRFYSWYLQISYELYRVLKPGGYFFSFSSPRLYHRMASAIDDAGFELRDAFAWLYTQNQMKAMSLNHFIDKIKDSEINKSKLKEKLSGWKTPQIKSCFEPIAMAQKPTDVTYLNNMVKHKVGLINTNIKQGDDMQPANVVAAESICSEIDRAFLVSKPSKEEKSFDNNHKTVKPLALVEYFLSLTMFDDSAVVLDPFMGSGTTAVAAQNLHKNYIGIEINQEYIETANNRLNQNKRF